MLCHNIFCFKQKTAYERRISNWSSDVCSSDLPCSIFPSIEAPIVTAHWGIIMRIDAISIGKNPPEDVNVIVEVPVGGHPIKYEMDKEAGALVVDRFLYTPMTYPGNYGFVPHTLSENGDPNRKSVV